MFIWQLFIPATTSLTYSTTPIVGNYTNNVGFVSDGPGDARADLGGLTIKDSNSDKGYALRLDGSPLGFQKFASNDLQGNWRGVIKVRPDSRSPMTLLSDDCTEVKKSDTLKDDGRTSGSPPSP
ncbi:uncharacterized protein LOC112572174 [Pomacea canaliculata]|uniref:uncharacterized protein LOC112572174 n=1 Tax=Pomacea canaliculata TaxID=400727 RepID=UPI000D73B1DB|nr:uncharacterized protein LOC112572174 [Pomacea canaliculata]